MYLTSFIHREELFDIAERWFGGRPGPSDALRLTEILICDGFVVAETVESLARFLIETVHQKPFHGKRIGLKGELRDVLCRHSRELSPRVEDLFASYRKNPDFYYREAPINGVMCLDEEDGLLGLYRIKRPRRIAEKANRRIAAWIFRAVQNRAQEMALERAHRFGVPLDRLFTPEHEMIKEFIEAEEIIARSFGAGAIRLERTAMTIRDVGGIKIVAEEEMLARLRTVIQTDPNLRLLDQESFEGNYQATSLILEVPWDAEHLCRRYHDTRSWEKYLHRGLPQEKLMKGLAPFLEGGVPKIQIEVILSTFPDMVESELGNSIHEERIRTQRDDRQYKGYIPMNIEFLVEFLFAVGFSPQIHIDQVPIKLWGRYLPDTLSSYIRRLYHMPDHDLFH